MIPGSFSISRSSKERSHFTWIHCILKQNIEFNSKLIYKTPSCACNCACMMLPRRFRSSPSQLRDNNEKQTNGYQFPTNALPSTKNSCTVQKGLLFQAPAFLHFCSSHRNQVNQGRSGRVGCLSLFMQYPGKLIVLLESQLHRQPTPPSFSSLNSASPRAIDPCSWWPGALAGHCWKLSCR